MDHCHLPHRNINQSLCWHHLKGMATVNNVCDTAKKREANCATVKIRFDWYLFSCLLYCNLHFIKRPHPPGSLSVVSGFIDRNESPLREGAGHVLYEDSSITSVHVTWVWITGGMMYNLTAPHLSLCDGCKSNAWFRQIWPYGQIIIFHYLILI